MVQIVLRKSKVNSIIIMQQFWNYLNVINKSYLKHLKSVIVYAALLLPTLLNGQFPYYKNFNINDGLASNKIYNIIEDKLGFIWICTDQGVSRYDGVNFRNFTSKDGLPDNEVLNLFEDSVGRIWFNGFSTEPCYYFQGKIYNAFNDSFLKRIKTNRQPGVCSNVIVQWNNSMAYIIQENGKKYLIGKDIQDILLNSKDKLQEFVYQHILYKQNNTYKLYSTFSVLEWKPNQGVKNLILFEKGTLFNLYKAPGNTIYSYNYFTSKVEKIDLSSSQNTCIGKVNNQKNIFFINNQIVLTSERSYSLYNYNFTQLIDQVSLPFKFERFYIDRRGNKWFGSFDKGLYFIRSQAPRLIDLGFERNEGILSIVPDGDNLIINTEKNGLLSLNINGKCTELLKDPILNRMMGFARLYNQTLLGTDNGLYQFNPKNKSLHLLKLSAIKDLELGYENEVLVGFSSGACIYQKDRPDSLQFIDFERTTSIARKESGNIWLGGLKGVREAVQKNQQYFTKRKVLNPEIDNSRIVDIKCDKQGNMWVATDQKGLFCCLLNGPILKFGTSTKSNYKLLSDVCVQILVANDNSIWLATLSGVSIIETKSHQQFNVKNFTISDGMPGKSIQSIAFWNSKIMVVTPQGLFEFKQFPNLINQNSTTLITGLQVNNKPYDGLNLEFSHKENNILIRYAASFVNINSEYLFEYRVKQLSKEWIRTNNLEVPLLGLEPGPYTFEIAAINAHNTTGEITKLNFVIDEPWYKTIWFRLLVLSLLVIVVLYFYKSAKVKINMGKNLSLFRLRIMRAQMNPHFVFNALSNIQNLIQKKELEQADDYIVTLSSIMRKSIDYSGKEFISLDKELDYTRNYLEIEKLRFDDKFDFVIDSQIDMAEQSLIYVPPLIIQPLVENAIKHAFKGMKEKGKIEILVKKLNENSLTYFIKDNGCGFDYSPNGAMNHGLDITKERLTLLFNDMKKNVKFTILSRVNEVPNGTTILIEIPILKD